MAYPYMGVILEVYPYIVKTSEVAPPPGGVKMPPSSNSTNSQYYRKGKLYFEFGEPILPISPLCGATRETPSGRLR